MNISMLFTDYFVIKAEKIVLLIYSMPCPFCISCPLRMEVFHTALTSRSR